MAVITSEKLISLWQADGHRVVTPHSLPDTQWMLNTILYPAGASEIHLSAGEVKQLTTGLYEHRKEIQAKITRKQARQRVNRLMELMNTLPNISAALMPESVLAHRPTTLPYSSLSFSAAHQMIELDRRILTWCRKCNTTEAWMLVLAIRFMTRLGMSEKVVLGTLSQLTLKHIDKKQKHINIPSSPDNSGHEDGHYRMVLPDGVWVPLRAIMTREKSLPDDAWLFSASKETSALSVKERRQLLRQRLIIAFRKLLKDYKSSAHASFSHLSTWPKIAKSSFHVPVLRGTPSLWSTLLREYPLPTCTPVPLRFGQADAHHYAPGNRMGRLPDRQHRRGPISDRDQETATDAAPDTRPAGVHVIATDHLPNDWPRQVKNILQQFLSSSSRLSKKTVKAKKHKKSMQEILKLHEKKICNLLGFSGHYPLWILHFLYHQLRTEGNTISTAKTYLSRLTPITMLYHDAVLDMSDWDDEVVLELEFSATEGSRWSDATLESFQGSFRNFIRFCQQQGILEDVTLPKKSNSLSPSVLRTRIISPDHMDVVWEELTKHEADGSSYHMKALVISLGFYGGLRASEIESLTLNDFQFGLKEKHGNRSCWIDILGGKTAAARRRIAFHIMAPPTIVEKLQCWVSVRRQESHNDALDDIALFGPRHSPDAYQRRHLITLAIDDMRYRLGEDIDFHGLRHAAVSWTLLRVHAAQHPGFGDTLFHRHHWMFQPQPLQDTLEFFCGAERVDTIERGAVLLHIAKWIGHRDPETLLRHYAHTLGLIHSDILAPPRR